MLMKKRQVVKLDPRTGILLLFLANIIAFTQQSLLVESVCVVLLLALITACGCQKAAGKLLLAFGICLLMQYHLLAFAPPIIGSSLFILVSYARKIFPCLIVGVMLIRSVSTRELLLALRRWHIPESFIIPFSVTLRYIPGIKEEISHIRDVMKLRNIKGFEKVECFVVPIIISASNTAEELSAAAVTRGIENPKKKTSMVILKMGIWDYVCIVVGVVLCVISITFK